MDAGLERYRPKAKGVNGANNTQSSENNNMEKYKLLRSFTNSGPKYGLFGAGVVVTFEKT